MKDCVSCGMPLDGGELTLPWADGDNPNAFIECPHCGYQNTIYGYGENED